MTSNASAPPSEQMAKVSVNEDASVPLGEDGKPLSKNALKKLQKDKEKAARAAEKAAAQKAQEEERQAKLANDPSSHLYGTLELKHTAEKPKDAITIFNLTELKANTRVIFRAWVYEVRTQGSKLAFLRLREGISTIQAVVAADAKLISTQMVKWAGLLTPESIVIVTGTAKEAPAPIKSASISHLEIQIDSIYCEVLAPTPLPMMVADSQNSDPSRPMVGLATKLDNRVLDLRGEVSTAIQNVSCAVCFKFQEYLLREQGFKLLHTPRILGGASEGGSEVFEIGYFGRPAFLSQSPQLHKQMAIAGGQRRVVVMGPVFRAENSNTARHMTEFTGLDFEMEIMYSYHEILNMLESVLLSIFQHLVTHHASDIATVATQYPATPFLLPPAGADGKVHFPHLTFSEAAALLQEAGHTQSLGDDLSTENERHLGALVREKHASDIFVLDQFPLAARPFYTMPADPNVPVTPTSASNSFDLIMRGQEICSGAQRIHSSVLLKERIQAQTEKKIDVEGEGLKAYLDAFRIGAPRHGGVGIGLERVVMLFLGLPNVKLASLFARDPVRTAP